MSLEDKGGTMLIDTLNPDFGGAVAKPVNNYLPQQRMRRLIFRSEAPGAPL